jgi:hypothetical protein
MAIVVHNFGKNAAMLLELELLLFYSVEVERAVSRRF